MRIVIHKELDVRNLREENRSLREALGKRYSHPNIVARSPKMQEVLATVERVAPTNATVLLGGESGVGKDLIARAIHEKSRRAKGPFLKINSTAIPENLLESELFGFEKGAFTGAVASKPGKFELADKGTLFLYEIGDVPPATQVKLLRVLQEREFERLGGTKTVKVDVRLIAATNRDLAEAVRKGEFRQDLYFRLNVVKLTMPSLRDRRDDIPMLTRHFVQKHAKRCKVKTKPVSREAMATLVNYDWPGNGRELENAVERALVMGSSDMLLLEDLPESLLEQSSPAEVHEGKYHASVKELKKQLIIDAVIQTRGNYVDAAKIMGVHANYLHRLIRNLGLKEELNRALRPRGMSGGAA